jgi:lysophospholipid acyltransferase (LPLAT)-like uncharacterized protein
MYPNLMMNRFQPKNVAYELSSRGSDVPIASGPIKNGMPFVRGSSFVKMGQHLHNHRLLFLFRRGKHVGMIPIFRTSKMTVMTTTRVINH